jgi:hypothetical protein
MAVIVTGGGADWVAAVKKVTGGAGVNVVYDGVGAPTFEKGFEALRTRGTMVLFGGAGGAVHSVPLRALQHGSKTLARPSLFDFIATPHEYKGRLAGLLKVRRPAAPRVWGLRTRRPAPPPRTPAVDQGGHDAAAGSRGPRPERAPEAPRCAGGAHDDGQDYRGAVGEGR